MLIVKPFTPNLNVEDVGAAGLPVMILFVGETDSETKAKIENAKEYTIQFFCDKLPKEKFPDSKAQRMFGASSALAKELAILSGQKAQQDGNYVIDESKLPGKKIVLVRVKSGGKFSSQDTLTIKK